MFRCLFLWNNVSGRILYVIPLIPKYVVFIVQPNTNTIMILFLSSQKLQYRSKVSWQSRLDPRNLIKLRREGRDVRVSRRESRESRIESQGSRIEKWGVLKIILMSLNQRFIYLGKNNNYYYHSHAIISCL